MKKKLALALVVVLAFAMGIGGTFAYLTAKTAAVQNTFTVGKVGTLTLDETTGTLTGSNRVHQIIPGTDTDKDPKVAYTAAATDEAVYVFVKIDAANWSFDAEHDTYTYLKDGKACLTWTVASGWTPLAGYTGVYYKELAKGESLSATSVIANNKIAVDGTNVTEANIQAVATGAGSLNFTAYAIQQAGFDGNVATAWTALNAQLAA